MLIPLILRLPVDQLAGLMLMEVRNMLVDISTNFGKVYSVQNISAHMMKV